MITLFDLGILAIFSIIGIFSFLHHEWFHIKSQGIFMRGRINVEKVGMTAMPEIFTNDTLYWYGGGIGSGILFLLAGLCGIYYGAWGVYVPLITFGVMQTFRGIQEGITKDRVKNQRYYVYIGSLFGMSLLWILHWWLFLR